MPYNRPYSLSDVVRILDASEHRPIAQGKQGEDLVGHAISTHSIERTNVFARPDGKTPPDKDSIFLISRNSLATIVHEALNSTTGQRQLQKLNGQRTKPVSWRTVVLRKGDDFDVLTVNRPEAAGSQMSVDWLSAAKGDGFIVDVLVKVYKLPASTGEDIHVQTAFPMQAARTTGDDIT